MTTNKRPISVWIVACLFFAVGILSLASHFRSIVTLQRDSLWVASTELAAIVCAVFLLRRENWARWLAIAWVAFHVVLSILDGYRGVVAHSLLLVLIAWLLFLPEATHYFRRAPSPP